MSSQLNQRAADLITSLCADELNLLDVRRVENLRPAAVLDFGADRAGTIAAGVLLARICMSDLATIRVTGQYSAELPLPMIEVATDHPLSACIASQYAGWPFSSDNYFAMCSGPARTARGREDVLKEYDLAGPSELAVGVFESAQLPTADNVHTFAAACNCTTENVTICVARTASLPGTIQVIARSVETTLHKLHELGFDLRKIRRGFGRAPLAPVAGDDLTALGWTNDSVLYGSCVWLWIDADDSEIQQVGPQIPSSGSDDFGTPFLETFNRYERDFYKIDKMLFSPAQVVIQSLQSGSVFSFGAVREDILKTSFGFK